MKCQFLTTLCSKARNVLPGLSGRRSSARVGWIVMTPILLAAGSTGGPCVGDVDDSVLHPCGQSETLRYIDGRGRTWRLDDIDSAQVTLYCDHYIPGPTWIRIKVEGTDDYSASGSMQRSEFFAHWSWIYDASGERVKGYKRWTYMIPRAVSGVTDCIEVTSLNDANLILRKSVLYP